MKLASLKVIQGHLPVARLFRYNSSDICATIYKIATDSSLHGPSMTAEHLVSKAFILQSSYMLLIQVQICVLYCAYR